MAWYDLNEKKESKKDYLARVKYDNIICEKVKALMDIVKLPIENNVQYRIITEQGFNAISVVEYISQKYEITEIYIAVYRMNLPAVRKIGEFIENESIKIGIILSSFFRENKKYERWCSEVIALCENKPNVKIKFEWNHAKVFLAKTTCGKHIVFEGSGNLSDNARIEQYLIEDNKTTYDFHKQWIDEYLNS